MSVRRNLDLGPDISRERQPAHIAVALVSHEMAPIRFAVDLANLTAYTVASMPEEVTFGTALLQGTYVHAARQEMLTQLATTEVTHILWIDTDMTFPRDALVRLMMHQKHVVGINYAKRSAEEPAWVALKKVGTNDTFGYALETHPESTGLEEVEGLGFGMVLMRTEVLGALPSPKEGPWFGFEWLEKRNNWVGEDIFFCNLLRKGGVKLYVDHDLSKECGHLGQYEFKTDFVSAARRAGKEGSD